MTPFDRLIPRGSRDLGRLGQR